MKNQKDFFNYFYLLFVLLENNEEKKTSIHKQNFILVNNKFYNNLSKKLCQLFQEQK